LAFAAGLIPAVKIILALKAFVAYILPFPGQGVLLAVMPFSIGLPAFGFDTRAVPAVAVPVRYGLLALPPARLLPLLLPFAALPVCRLPFAALARLLSLAALPASLLEFAALPVLLRLSLAALGV